MDTNFSPTTNPTTDENEHDQIDSSTTKYTEKQMMEALQDHAEEIKNILADVDNEEAQRAGFDLLYGDDYDGEMTAIC